MAKKVAGFLKLQVPAGAATPSPPIGPALGQRGINIMEFCKAFNAQSQDQEKGSPIPVVITYYQDKSFTFQMKTPPVSYFLKQAASLKKGGPTPGRAVAGSVSRDKVREIANKDERPECGRHRSGDANGRRFSPFHGPKGCGVRSWQPENVFAVLTRASIRRRNIHSTRQ